MSPYCASAARAATRAGFSCLRLSLRGADYSGEDILHGGITQDVWAALAAPAVAHYKHVLLIGYSVGGHIALKAAIERADPRLRAVAAICPPLDLHEASTAFDHPVRRPYRLTLFQKLDKALASHGRAGRGACPPSRCRARPVLPRARLAHSSRPLRFSQRRRLLRAGKRGSPATQSSSTVAGCRQPP